MNAIELMAIANPYYGGLGTTSVVSGQVFAQHSYKSDDFILLDYDSTAPDGYVDAGPYQLLTLALRQHHIPEEWKNEKKLNFLGVVFVDKSYEGTTERAKYGCLHWIPCITWHKDDNTWRCGERIFLENMLKTPYRKKVCFKKRSLNR